uniref:BEACH domain-containing protein n=1 Tax=Wuchereria bancrofti TaxID=6293 RepID=A0A1I8ESQ5_WUCBA
MGLRRPMAIQDKRLEEHYLRKYSYLAREEVQAVSGCGSPFMLEPYHYGSHYSNIVIIAHYLVDCHHLPTLQGQIFKSINHMFLFYKLYATNETKFIPAIEYLIKVFDNQKSALNFRICRKVAKLWVESSFKMTVKCSKLIEESSLSLLLYRQQFRYC